MLCGIFIGMDIKKIIKEELDDFDWARDVPDDPLINKAFYFDPIATDGDEDYRKLTQFFLDMGFVNEYNSPLELVGRDEAVGLFTYKQLNSGKLCFVHTEYLDPGESYYDHIRGFAIRDSVDGGDVRVVDAREYVGDMGL